MALTVTDLNSLNQTDVDTNFNTLVELIQEAFPDVDLKRGVLHDFVLYLAALLTTANQENIDLVRRSTSLSEITADPTLADDAIVDDVLSNYRITRKTPTSASGTVTIVVSELLPVTIGLGEVFTYNNLTFTSDDVYNARTTEGTVINTNDRLLTAITGGYAFTINVTASETGSAYRLKKDAALTMSSPPPNFVSAYVESDFEGGTDAETNSQLLARLEAGGAVKAWCNRDTNKSLILSQEEFADVLDVSEVGFGDSEMTRYHSIFPVAFGGRTDLYVRPQDLPKTTVLTKTATLIAKTGTVGTWQFSVGADDAPGFYEVKKITQTDGSGNYSVASDTRSLNTSVTTTVPDVTEALEATYSRYSTAVVTFDDTDTDATALTTGVSTQSYSVHVKHMPLIAELQDFISGRDVTNPAGDVLVKSAVPCYMSVSFNINKYSSDPTPDTTKIKTAVAAVVNKSGFPGMFSASSISKAVHDVLTGTTMTISGIDMIGKIRRPDGTTTLISSAELLTVPSDPTSYISGKTVVFILDPDDIVITVVPVSS